MLEGSDLTAELMSATPGRNSRRQYPARSLNEISRGIHYGEESTMHRTFCVIVARALASAASGQTPAFDPREWKGAQAGPVTRILNLGSPHLAQMPAAVNEAMLSGLLDKLAAFKPDIITAENVSGEQCEHLKRYSGIYPEAFDSWCSDSDLVRKAIGIDTPAAAAGIRKALSNWPAQPSAAARRRLAALFLAAGANASALVQWKRLPPDERHAGDGVNSETLKLLEGVGSGANETYQVGVALAVRLGLERVFLVDDHTSDGILADEGPAFAEAIQAAWKTAPAPSAARANALSAALKTPADMLELYRFINLPETQRQTIQADFRAALRQQTPGLYGRHYVAAWEVRNLRMVANIRAACGARPGARVLNIVGASHKPYYDAYLNLMPDIELVDVETVLK